MKKTIFINILIACLLVFAGVVISKEDSSNYQNLMNRGNIYEGALIYPTKSKQTVPHVLKRIKQKKITGFQMYFIKKSDPNISYVYMSRDIKELPMNTGRYFTKQNFDSQIPFVILGSEKFKTVYKPQTQPYYKIGNKFYSVLGSVGFKNTDQLNNHVFISTSPKQKSKAKVKNYQVVLDGEVLRHPENITKIKHVLRAKKPYRSANHINHIQQSWLSHWGIATSLLLVIAIAVLVLSWFVQVPSLNVIKNTILTGDLLTDFRLGNWLKFFIAELITFIISFAIVSFKIVIISWNVFDIYMIGLFIIVNLLAGLRFLMSSNNGGKF